MALVIESHSLKCSVVFPGDLQIIGSVDKFWKFRIEVIKF